MLAVRRIGQAAVLLAMAAVLVTARPAAADLFSDVLKEALGPATSRDKEPAPGKQWQSGNQGQGQKRSPADGPAAMVEEVSPGAGIGLFDYAYPGQRIELGADGALVLSYFASCVTESIRGGSVTIGTESSRVRGGSVRRETIPCQSAGAVVAADASEAGAAAKRVTPFDDAAWAETTIRSDRPLFKWPRVPGRSARILYLDAPTPRLVWDGAVEGTHFVYPRQAPALEPGMPYQVEVTLADGRTVSAVFSIDPGLEVAGAFGRLVAIDF